MFGPEEMMCKAGAKAVVAIKDNSTSKTPSTLFRDKKKDAFRGFSGISKTRTLNCKGINLSFE